MSPRQALLLAAALALCGCRHREITKLEREEAANMASEADFAVTVKEWSRAEGLYSKAAALCPDTGDLWLNLGVVRMRLGDHGGDPAHIEVGAARSFGALQAIVHVDADRLVPVAMVRRIDRKLLSRRGHAHVSGGQMKRP